MERIDFKWSPSPPIVAPWCRLWVYKVTLHTKLVLTYLRAVGTTNCGRMEVGGGMEVGTMGRMRSKVASRWCPLQTCPWIPKTDPGI